MSLNIKNAEAHQLAKELSSLTGESMAQAVTDAIREKRDRLSAGQAGGAEALLAIGRDCAGRLDDTTLEIDHGDLLYDAKGLPR